MMNQLTKQWFDDANQDAAPTRYSEGQTRVTFHKSKTSPVSSNNSKLTVDKKTYHNLNNVHGATSNVLLDSTDDDDYEDQEEIVIDQIQLINSARPTKP